MSTFFPFLSIVAKYSILNNASSVGNIDFDFVTFLSCLLKFSIEFVVYINFLSSGGYLKKLDSSCQLARQDPIAPGYFLPHFSSNLSRLPSAISSVVAL